MKKNLPAFSLGLLATSLQIFLLREFNAYFYGNELTFGIVLASWLLWSGLGSLAAGKMRSLPGPTVLFFSIILVFPFALTAVRLSRLLFGLLPGELAGLLPVILMSIGICALVGFPLGALFVVNVHHRGGDIKRVYTWESLGAAAAGPAVSVGLLLFASSWVAATALSALVVVLIFCSSERRPSLIWTAALFIVLAGFGLADLPVQRLHWQPFRLIASRDSLHGRLQIVKTREQISLYSNHSPVFSYPDIASAEESVHFAMLQSPAARRVLLIGGSAGQSLDELLKYPNVQVDAVELDPEIIRMSNRFLGDAKRDILASGRVRILAQDGRAFLEGSRDEYEVIILNLPEPATAQINRFYTREFFDLARRHLRSGGFFSFSIASSENVIGPELRKILASLYFTLKSVFPEVRVVPGGRNIFLASSNRLTIDPSELGRRIDAFGLSTRHLEIRSLESRLHPLRIEYLQNALGSGPRRINTDLNPISFFLQASLWSAHFQGPESAIIRTVAEVPPGWLLGCPLLLFTVFLVLLRLKKREVSFSLVPLAVMGLTTIVAEIVLLLWFQSLYGYLYGRVALLLSTFMLGLFLGASLKIRPEKTTLGSLAAVQTAFLALLAAFRIVLPTHPPEFLAYLLLLLFGFLGGRLFIVSNLIFLRTRADYGRGYGLDLIGSFAGALLTSSLLIPLAGQAHVLESVLVLNAICLLFLLARPKPARWS
ncbi:MAG: hypothetical protein JXE07_02785, partial [Candidatus Aminicenantes bacterium]|nr:hypothetical protein [Candidatus Aminicenantes bacterium]